MTARKQTREELLVENAVLKQRLRASRTSRIGTDLTFLTKILLQWGITGATIVYALRALAGHATTADIAVDLGEQTIGAITDLAPHWALQLASLAICFFALRSNARFRRINRDLVQQVSAKTKALEEAADPGRSSSGLGHDGETHKRDRR